MQIEMLKPSAIKPYERNPRKNDQAVEPVMNSIREFGFKVPIVIDRNNVIVCGHTRWKASKRLGLTEVPCIRADDLTDEQIRAFRLADNKAGELAEWDHSFLDFELKAIDGIDMSLFGFGEIPTPLMMETESGDIEEFNGAINLKIRFERLKDLRKCEGQIRELLDEYEIVGASVSGEEVCV